MSMEDTQAKYENRNKIIEVEGSGSDSNKNIIVVKLYQIIYNVQLCSVMILNYTITMTFEYSS